MRPSFNISNFAKVKHTGYQYDALGRNILIPAADTPNGGNAITLAYNTNDQITQISQSGATTNFSYEAEGRRLNETSGNTTTTRHYTDGSDNQTWTTQAATATPNTITKTEIYTPSLGTGLNITTTIQNGSATGSMQLHDLRGNTVTTIDLTTNTASGWCSYDEFGNQDSTNPGNTNLINYSTYAGAERATNATGLILMGARVYNPETNQFTSPDPVQGGNENSYSYPNDPVNHSDFTGLWSWWDSLDVALTVASFIPIPGLQEVAWVAKAVSMVSKIAKASKIVAKAVSFVVRTSHKAKDFASITSKFAGEGTYEFMVGTRKYVGRSVNVARRLAEHNRYWTGKGQAMTDIVFHRMPNSTIWEQRVFEQRLIDKYGGVKSDFLLNKINSIGK